MVSNAHIAYYAGRQPGLCNHASMNDLYCKRHARHGGLHRSYCPNTKCEYEWDDSGFAVIVPDINPDATENAMTQQDATNPDYYKFPNGTETIDLAEWLSACGSQAVQYIARATRIDGKVKGNPIEDLRKSVWFIQREIARLEAQNAVQS